MWSNSTMKIAKNINVQMCEYSWTIDHRLTNDRVPVSSPYFGAENNNGLKWYLFFSPQSGLSENISRMWLLAVRPGISNTINPNETIGGEFVVSCNSNTTTKYIFILDESAKKYNDGRVVKCFDISKPASARNDDLTVKCQITYFNMFDSIPLSISHFWSEINKSNPLEDYGKLYLNEEHTDVTMCIKSKDGQSKEYPAHKLVLAVRSKVFEAMFKHEMEENKRDRVIVEDINEEVFLEALRYIYTGRVENLDTLVYELLPVADKYDLEELKIICGNVLQEKLSVETAIEIVILVDMHNIGDLRKNAIQFIKHHSADVIKKMDSEAWDGLKCRPNLMKDLLIASMT